MASATTPPIAASRIRFGENAPPPDGPVITSSIAETAASEITSSEPLSRTATDIASTTMIASCGAPVPMKWMITSATARPVTTPATSWVARWRCAPCEAPIAITAAMQAKTGCVVRQQRMHTYHAASAATAVCRIASARALQAAAGGRDVHEQQSYV